MQSTLGCEWMASGTTTLHTKKRLPHHREYQLGAWNCHQMHASVLCQSPCTKATYGNCKRSHMLLQAGCMCSHIDVPPPRKRSGMEDVYLSMRKNDWHVHLAMFCFGGWLRAKLPCGILAHDRHDKMAVVLVVVGLSWAHVIDFARA
jgi:hypothetical protein